MRFWACGSAVRHFLFIGGNMEYSQRFTERMEFLAEEINAEPEYLVKADVRVIAERLGLYEDLGFSPEELAQILLNADCITPDKKDLIRVALERIRRFDAKCYYLREAYSVT